VGPVHWRTGDQVRVTVADVVGTHDRVSVTYAGLAADVCAVKDVADLECALRLGVDWVALSFVRSPNDIDLVHRVMDQVPGGRLPVIVKLEKPEAVDNLEAIVLAFDGLMVARGDLGVELALEQVPLVQKRAVQVARQNAKPVIVATQMLDSMISNTRPTRAEASDVANAVLDGADAVMLSGETSVGRYPIESVDTMSRIICATEASVGTVPPLNHVPHTKRGSARARPATSASSRRPRPWRARSPAGLAAGGTRFSSTAATAWGSSRKSPSCESSSCPMVRFKERGCQA